MAPIVPLTSFFQKGEGYGRTGRDLVQHPGPKGFFEHLLLIWSRPEVQDVLIEVCGEGNPVARPASECVYILTTASVEDVVEWMRPLQPDVVEERRFSEDKSPVARGLRRGVRVYSARWN